MQNQNPKPTTTKNNQKPTQNYIYNNQKHKCKFNP